jgi:hypothetical protein
MRKFALIASFLFFFFGAIATYRRLILSQYQIDYFQYGYAVIEALVLGKVILVGEIFHLGDRFQGKPLIVPTLYRTVSFSILVLIFAVLEHFVRGFIHGEKIAVIVGDLAAKDGADIAAKILVMFIAFIRCLRFGKSPICLARTSSSNCSLSAAAPPGPACQT